MNTLKIAALVALFLITVSAGVLQASPRTDCEDAGCRYTYENGTWFCDCD